MNKIIEILRKNKKLLLYLFFGVCTTAINTICYWMSYDVLTLSNIVSTILAWLAAVAFAFVTNKVFVFESKRATAAESISEVISFFVCRLLTGILDMAIMAIAVDMLQQNGLFWKLFSNVIVTVINYVASKILIFKGCE